MPRVRADRLHCALQDRVFSLGTPPGDRHWRGILLTSGSGAVIDGDDILDLRAPTLAWLPWRESMALRIKAGGVGFQFTVSNEVLANAVGHNSESADLRLLVERRVVASLEAAPDALADAEYAFDLIVRETLRPRSGTGTMLEAQVRSVLVLLWRLSAAPDVAIRVRGQSSRVLQHFRQLLEMHFRDRWPVGAYADAIGVGPDRLHDVCRRQLGKAPRQLVQERMIHEARLRLERSTQTVEQVAGSLGFRDVGHFSRFFKSKVGLPPAAYRERAARAAAEGAEMPASTFADWP
jgi:AraC family transcriptional activator of pobA